MDLDPKYSSFDSDYESVTYTLFFDPLLRSAITSVLDQLEELPSVTF